MAPASAVEERVQGGSWVVLDIQPRDYVHGPTSPEAVPRRVSEPFLVGDGLDQVNVRGLDVREKPTTSS